MYYERLHDNTFNVQSFCEIESIAIVDTQPTTTIVQESKPHLLVELPDNDYSIFINGDIANIFLEIGNTSKFNFNDVSYNFDFTKTNFFDISFQARNITRTFLDDNTLHSNNVPYLNANYIYPTITNDNGDIINNIPTDIIQRIGIYNLTYNLTDPSTNAESIIIIKLNIVDTQPISVKFNVNYVGLGIIQLFNEQTANLPRLEKLVTGDVDNSYNTNTYNNWPPFNTFRNTNFLGRTFDNDPCFNNLELIPSNISFFNTDNSSNHYWQFDLSINDVSSKQKGIFYIRYNLENNSGNAANDLSCTLIQEIVDELPQIYITGYTNNSEVSYNQYIPFTIPTISNGLIHTINGDKNPVYYITDPQFYNTTDISQGNQRFNFIYNLIDNAGNIAIFTFTLVVIDLLPKITVRYRDISYNNDFTSTIDQYDSFILPDVSNGKVTAKDNDDNPITKNITYTNELSDSSLITFNVLDISNTYVPGKYIITYSTIDNQDNSANLIFTLIIENRDPELTVNPSSITKNRITDLFDIETEITVSYNYYQRNKLTKTYETISGGDGTVFDGTNINNTVLGHYRIIYSIDNYNPYNYLPLGIESITKTVDIHFVDNTSPELEIRFWDGVERIFSDQEVYNKNINQSYIKENISEDFTPTVIMVYDQTRYASGQHPHLIDDISVSSHPIYNIGETRIGTYTFTFYLPDDGFGNSTTVTINLTINDDIFPIITLGSVLNFGGLSTPFKSLSTNGNSKIFTYNTNIIDISESLVNVIGYYQLPSATALDFSGIDLSVNIPDLSGAISPKNTDLEVRYSAIDDASNQTIFIFRYRINDNLDPTFTEISYDINNTGSFTNYNDSDLIEFEEFLHVYIKFTVNEGVNFTIYENSGNFVFDTLSSGTSTTLKLNDTSPGDYYIKVQADDGVNQKLSTRVLIRINPIPYFTFRIQNNGTDNILQLRYKTYIKDSITYNYLNTLTIKFLTPLTNIGLISPTGILINVDGIAGNNFSINNLGTKIISISTNTIVGNALFTNYDDGVFMDLINIGSNEVNIDQILTLFIFNSKDLVSGRSFYYIQDGILNADQDVSISNLTNNYIVKNRNIHELYNSEFLNLPNQLIFFNEDYTKDVGGTIVGYVDICNNPRLFFNSSYNPWIYEAFNWANQISGSSQPPTIQDFHFDDGDGDIIIQSRYKLIPGIINGDQDLGDGLPYAMNIFDPSECILYDLTVIDLDNNILFNIDQSDNIYISCLPDSSYKNMQIWTILFNIFDVSGWLLLANQDVELNIINNYGYNSNSNFDISLSKIEISGISNISNDKFILECSQNILSLKTTDIGSDICGQIIDNIYFNIKDENGIILDNSMIFLLLTPFTGYELGLGDSTYNFIIRKTVFSNTTNLIIGNQPQVFAKIFPYGYNILPNVSYFNINNITVEENNLLKLDSSGVLIGKLNFLSS